MNGRCYEGTSRKVVDRIERDPQRLGLVPRLTVGRPVIGRGDRQERTGQVPMPVAPPENLQLALVGQVFQRGGRFGADDRDPGARFEQALDLVLGDRPASDDDTPASTKVEIHGIKRRHTTPPKKKTATLL